MITMVKGKGRAIPGCAMLGKGWVVVLQRPAVAPSDMALVWGKITHCLKQIKLLLRTVS